MGKRTSANATKIMKIIKEYKKKLSMEDVNLNLAILPNDKCDEECTAEIVNAGYLQNKFVLMLNETKLDEDLKNTLVHELLHMLLWDLTQYMESLVSLSSFNESKKNELYEGMLEKEHVVIEKLITAIL